MNHDEAVACFKHALAEDPELAFAWWGIAYCVGPNYNKPWEAFDDEERKSSLAQAQEEIERGRACGAATQVERDLIDTIAVRYPTSSYGVPSVEECDSCIQHFAESMDSVLARHDADLDVLTV